MEAGGHGLGGLIVIVLVVMGLATELGNATGRHHRVEEDNALELPGSRKVATMEIA